MNKNIDTNIETIMSNLLQDYEISSEVKQQNEIINQIIKDIISIFIDYTNNVSFTINRQIIHLQLENIFLSYIKHNKIFL